MTLKYHLPYYVVYKHRKILAHEEVRVERSGSGRDAIIFIIVNIIFFPAK